MIHTDLLKLRTSVRLLECKGTLNLANQAVQLVSAVIQLEGVHINGKAPSGLAVSTATPDDGAIRFLAVDPPSDDESYDLGLDREDVDRDPAGGEMTPEGEVVGGGRGPTRPYDPDLPQPANGLLEATGAQLADYAGNREAASAWAPETLRTRLDQRVPENRVEVATDIGSCIGRRGIVTFGDRQVQAFCGVPVELDDALASGTASRVLAEQATLLGVRAEYEELTAEEPSEAALAIRGDGAVLQVRLLT